jgi:hypothetical protein
MEKRLPAIDLGFTSPKKQNGRPTGPQIFARFRYMHSMPTEDFDGKPDLWPFFILFPGLHTLFDVILYIKHLFYIHHRFDFLILSGEDSHWQPNRETDPYLEWLILNAMDQKLQGKDQLWWFWVPETITYYDVYRCYMLLLFIYQYYVIWWLIIFYIGRIIFPILIIVYLSIGYLLLIYGCSLIVYLWFIYIIFIVIFFLFTYLLFITMIYYLLFIIYLLFIYYSLIIYLLYFTYYLFILIICYYSVVYLFITYLYFCIVYLLFTYHFFILYCLFIMNLFIMCHFYDHYYYCCCCCFPYYYSYYCTIITYHYCHRFL